MAYLTDLSEYSYSFIRPEPPAVMLNVGWLAGDQPYSTGECPPGFVARLRELARTPQAVMRGLHFCEFCPGPTTRSGSRAAPARSACAERGRWCIRPPSWSFTTWPCTATAHPTSSSRPCGTPPEPAASPQRRRGSASLRRPSPREHSFRSLQVTTRAEWTTPTRASTTPTPRRSTTGRSCPAPPATPRTAPARSWTGTSDSVGGSYVGGPRVGAAPEPDDTAVRLLRGSRSHRNCPGVSAPAAGASRKLRASLPPQDI